MNYLAVNTASNLEILLKRGQKRFYHALDEKTLASSKLMVLIEDAFKKASIGIDKIDVFGVCIGPGSFTGIRIGVSAIRALGFALNKLCVGVTLFDCLAYDGSDLADSSKKSGLNYPLTAVIDGKNGVCYLKNFAKEYTEDFSSESGICIKNTEIKRHARFDIIADTHFDAAVEDCRIPKGDGSGLGGAIEAALNMGLAGKYSKISPLYLRRSQPERATGEI